MTKQTQKRFSVQVTEADIARAQRNSSYKCVVAQAIARTIKEAHHISVDAQTIKFTIGEERRTYVTPDQVYDYIVKFDAGDEIEPLKFVLTGERMLPVRRRVETPTGRAASKAAFKAKAEVLNKAGLPQKTQVGKKAEAAAKTREAAAKAEDATAITSKVATTSKRAAKKLPTVEVIEEARAASKQAYEAARAANPGKPKVTKSSPGAVKPKRKVERTYGKRAMRINQDRFKDQPAASA